MITNVQMGKALFYLDAAGCISAKAGQADIWHEIVSEATPNATDEDLLEAAKYLARIKGGGSWTAVADLVAAIKQVRNKRIDIERNHARQIEAGFQPVVSINAKAMFEDVKQGYTEDQVAERARQRHQDALCKSQEEA